MTSTVDFIRKYMKKNVSALFLLFTTVYSQPHFNGAELQLAVNKLSVLGSVLYVAAHPDDENTALLSYFAKERLYRTAYLSLTRGEGGQNLIGSELGAELGVIRTQELLAARRIDGAEQYFTRAIDFGFSKSAEEALRLWNKDSVLKDVVWIIRKFRPDIIITRFSPTQGGHGHHLASAILAQEAFKISGDSTVFPEQLRYVRPWKAKRILFNAFRSGEASRLLQQSLPIVIDVGAYNPLLGISYTELAGISRSMHKSQGMGSPQQKGSFINTFIVTDGEPAAQDVMEGVDVSWKKVKEGKQIEKIISQIQKKFSPLHPAGIVPLLLQLRKELLKQPENFWCTIKMKEVESLLLSTLGFSAELIATDHSYTNGDSIAMTLSLINRSSVHVLFTQCLLEALSIKHTAYDTLRNNQRFEQRFSAVVPTHLPYTSPYWLVNGRNEFLYSITNQSDIGMPEQSSPLTATVTLYVQGEKITFSLPLKYKWIDDINGEQYRSVEIVPPVSVSLMEKNVIGKESKRSLISLRVKSLKNNLSGSVRLRVPEGWTVSATQPFGPLTKNQEITVQLYVQPHSSASSGECVAEAVIDGKGFSQTVKRISYSHIPLQTVLGRASGKLLKMNLQKRGTTIGYIMGAGDDVPKALEQMGYAVSLLSDEELLNGDLSKYDAIVAGIRSYNTREQLRLSNARLLQYVANGGRYIVQYQTLERGYTDNIAPYPMEISRERVTDEQAPVTFTNPKHPLLTHPNQISEKDFNGWVQERGLYFASTWDKKFETMISFADPKEKQQEGSLLCAQYGKGYYIFTGLSFFRQLPAGVEGAYKLFANVVSVGQ